MRKENHNVSTKATELSEAWSDVCMLPIEAPELTNNNSINCINAIACSCVIYLPSHVFAVDFLAVYISKAELLAPWFPQKGW